MALIKCPDCKNQVSDKAAMCIHCGCPMTTEKVATEKPPRGSIGKCPACGSVNTYDTIEKARQSGGFFQAMGARVGGRLAGRGRYECRKCLHTWEFGKHM